MRMEYNCFTHPTRQALSFCHSCGRYFCSDCLVGSEEFYYCKDETCQNKLREEKLVTPSEYDEQEDKARVSKRISRLGTWIWPHITDAESAKKASRRGLWACALSQKEEQEVLGVKMKRKNILFYISVLVVILASILWLLYQKREHDRLIAFEQKKQEVRQLMIEGQLLMEKLDERLSVAIDAEDTSELREKAARLLDRSKYIQQGTKSTLASLETLRNVSDKEALGKIERIVTGMQENNKRGRELLDQFDRSLSNKAAFYHNRGNDHRDKGKYDEAISDYTKVLKIDPTNAAVYNELAWLHGTAKEPRIRSGKKAIELALRACELSDWKNPDYLDTLAAAYARADDFSNATKWQERALQLFDKDEKAEAQERLNLYRGHRPWPPD